jgi:hypothetical protein
LIAQQRLLGYSMPTEGAFGRFRGTDRDLMAMLAAAAIALDNARWAQGLSARS